MAKKSFTFSASLIATLKERIITWKYPPEHRLTEDALCREFGVSRSPVREALRVLATNGFVRWTANRGYAVRQVKVNEVEEMYECVNRALSPISRARGGRRPSAFGPQTDPLEPPGRRCGCWPMSLISF